MPNRLFVSDNIGTLRPKSVPHAALAAGVLGIPLSHVHGDYIMLFRRERLRDIKWAGEPVKIEARGGSIPRLSPRKSFEAFAESIRGFSRPFTGAECRVAEAVQSGLMEIIRRESRNVDAGHQRATERQELLIAELNHRVRNVLALIRGLISQTMGEDGDAASYVKSLALEAEDMLRVLGASLVYTASTIGAVSVLEGEQIHFAVLDINLGAETSLEFASRVCSLKIPFIFASGYGGNINVGGPNHSVLTVTKPYDREDPRFGVSSTLDGGRDHPAEIVVSRLRMGCTFIRHEVSLTLRAAVCRACQSLCQ